ncbi:hypothetical protein N7486_001013 [Penicillium sp. IBT 16267x]|nr:hypothetical protein N7486_001013 [Penicillium sp. IBT 16267x]
MPPKRKFEDLKAFLTTPGPEPKYQKKNKPPTNDKVRCIGRNFDKFMQELDLEPPRNVWLEEKFTMRLVETFLRWYLNRHDIERQSALSTTSRFFTMFHKMETKKGYPLEIEEGLPGLLDTLTEDYDLKLVSENQPSFGIDDLLYTAYHLLAWCPVTFPTMRSIFQLNTLREMMACTTARPGTLIESSGYVDRNDALKWKDIELFMVKHPESATSQVLLMRVRHRLNKGKRNEGASSIFTYTERNDNLGLCVIQDILMYAFLDDAFASEHIKCPRDIWRLTIVPEHRLSTPIQFKKSIKEIPILRGSRNEGGYFVTDPQSALRYSQARAWEINCSISAGFENEGTLYKYRKGAATKIRELDEHTRNKIMGHARGQTFAHYISNLVTDDTQSLFMETPTRNSLLSLSTHASITRDPSAPQELTATQKEAVESDDLIQTCLSDRERLRSDVISQYGQLKHAKASGDKRFHELQRLGNKTKARRRRLCHKALVAVRREFFEQVGNQTIESNAAGKPIDYTPDTSGAQPERLALAALEFQNRDVNEIDDDQLIEDRILSLELRLELNKLRVPSGCKHTFDPRRRKISEVKTTRNRRARRKITEEISPYNALSVREIPLLPAQFKCSGTLEKIHSNGISRRFMSQRCHSVRVGIYATSRAVMYYRLRCLAISHISGNVTLSRYNDALAGTFDWIVH